MKNKLGNHKLTYFTTIFIVLLSIQCQYPKYNNENVNVINIYKGIEKSDTVKLSSIASHIEYLKLETNNESLISWPEKIDICKNELFVMDKKTSSFLRFDITGQFLNRIGKSGIGNGEYKEIGGFSFNESGDVVFLYSRVSGGEILKYTKYGKYIGSVAKNTGFHVTLINKSYFCNLYTISQLNNSNFYSIQIFDSLGNITKRLHPKNNLKNKATSKITVLNSQIYTLRDSLTFWEGRSDTIFRISNDYKIQPRFVINFDKYKIPNSLLNDVERFKSEISGYAHLFSFFETENYFFFNLAINRLMKFIIYDKKTQTSINIFDNSINLINDIDGGLPFWPTGRLSDGRLYMFIDVVALKSFVTLNSDKKNTTSGYIGISEEVKKLCVESGPNDNPIIMIITLK